MNKANYSDTFQKFGSNFIQHFGTNYSKFGRNYSGLWEKFRDSEIQKLLRNYSETISEIIRRKNLFRRETLFRRKTLFRNEFFGTN